GTLIYLAAAVIAVPLAKLLGLGSIIGYLGAGILIGPWGLQLVTDPKEMLRFAEFGVVLMLFLVGLELEPRRLWSLRKPIFGWGNVQLLASAALMAAVGLAMALGAFLAGVLLAESEYRRELETDIEPFKGLLLGLFFIAVGMSIDFAVVLQRPGLIALLVASFLLLKAAL